MIISAEPVEPLLDSADILLPLPHHIFDYENRQNIFPIILHAYTNPCTSATKSYSQ